MNNNPRVWETEWLEYELQQRGVWDKLHPFIVDCGAGDGEYCSNSKLFIEKYGWDALLIDGLDSNIDRINEKYGDNYRVLYYTALLSNEVEDVYFEENQSHWSVSKIKEGTPNRQTTKLSTICKNLFIENIGILSLDIEGNEHKVLMDLFSNTNIKPQVIIIEGNTFHDMQFHRDMLRGNYGDPIGGILPNQFFLLNELK